MKLSDIAFSSYVYKNLTSYLTSYLEFRKAVGWCLDLNIATHREQLYIWLNRWGCRLPKEDKAHIQKVIKAWFRDYEGAISRRQGLGSLGALELQDASLAYKALRSSDIGPTAASKILFAVWPKSMVPWDVAIRKGLSLDETSDSYLFFLKTAHYDFLHLREECKKREQKLSELPESIGRKESTVSQLIGEYYWVTLTKKCQMPDQALLKEWLYWT